MAEEPQPFRYSTHAVLRDGRPILIRSVGEQDFEPLLTMLTALENPAALSFFTGRNHGWWDPLMLVSQRHPEHPVLLAERVRTAGSELWGVGHYEPLSAHRARIGIAVADERRGMGTGTVLIEQLVSIGEERGIEEFEAAVLPTQTRLLEVFDTVGLAVHHTRLSDRIKVVARFPHSRSFARARLRRAATAQAESARGFANPKTIAVVGASRDAEKIGSRIFSNIVAGGFTGEIFAVNSSAAAIQGRTAYRSVRDIPAQVDLVFVAVPARALDSVIRDCVDARVHGAVVITSGLGEAGEEGREQERRVTKLARDGGVRLLGPNCFGLLNTDPGISLSGTFGECTAVPGNVALLSQSGALGVVLLTQAKELGLGLSQFVSIGNRADLSSNDFLAYWGEDNRTAVVALYLESFGNPRNFSAVAQEVSRRKPIVAVKAGRSPAGARAAASHTAALVEPENAVDALFEQAGIIRVQSFPELIDSVRLLSSQPLPAGRRVGIVTNAGGPGILLSDGLAAAGLDVPELSAAARAELGAFLPAHAATANPIDLTAAGSPGQYVRAAAVLAPEVDSLVMIVVPTGAHSMEEYESAVREAARGLRETCPLVAVISASGAPAAIDVPARGRVPAFRFAEEAARPLALAARYAERRARGEEEPAVLFDRYQTAAIRSVLTAAGPGWLRWPALQTVLLTAGIECASGKVVAPESALHAAAEVGYPLVAKIVSHAVLHKTEVGGVAVGVAKDEELRRVVARFEAAAERGGFPLEGVLLQRYVREGVEAYAGITHDPSFGPIVACGFGGVALEVTRDIAYGLPPIGASRAHDMTERLRGKALFEGFRGAPPCDRRAFEELIARVGALAETFPELLELDLNPIKLRDEGAGAIVVDARARVGTFRSSRSTSRAAPRTPGIASLRSQ